MEDELPDQGILASVMVPVTLRRFGRSSTNGVTLPRLVTRFVALALVVSSIAAALAAGGTPSGAAAKEPRPLLEITDDRGSLRLRPAGEGTAIRYTIEEWRAWAEENLVRQLGEPVRIGGQEMPPGAFDGFGAAELAPGGDRLAFTVTTYAMLTTISVVTILELDDRSIQVVKDQVTGGTDELSWSSDGHYLAYAVDTARAPGERLRIDDTRELVNELTLGAGDLLEAASSKGQDTGVRDARQWLPRIRMLYWVDGWRLRFVSDYPRAENADRAEGSDGAGEDAHGVHWSVSPKTGELRGELTGR